MTARSYYFGTGTRRHVGERQERSGYVVMRCGLSGYFGKVRQSQVEPNCRHCLARLSDAERNGET